MSYCHVAPLVGAWIEICYEQCHERGCKVAPLVGAWIEIQINMYWNPKEIVAPLVGAWIEISKPAFRYVGQSSLPSWERGLK